MFKIIKTVFILLVFCSSSFADQDGSFNYDADKQQEKNKASNASFDKRLPPVLPGEVLNDGQGKTKVWSTAGSVSSSAVPAAPAAPINGGYDGAQPAIGGVIVDDRGGHFGRK